MEYFKKLIHDYSILLLILIFAFSIRIYNLSSVPYGFFCDEASIGYNAYSILTTGKDEYGTSFPVFFKSLGDYRPPVEIYSTVPFVFIMGLNEVSTRLTSVFFGLLTIVALYYLGKYIYSKEVGLFTTLAAATMPWLIHYNRAGFEFSSYCAFFTITALLFVLASHHKKFIIPAFIFSALTLYTYQPAKLLSPLLLVGILLIYRKGIIRHRKELLAAMFLFLLFSVPFILSFFNGEATARFNMVSVFSSHLSLPDVLLKIIANYLTQLSPFLFISGENTLITRHFTQGLMPLLVTTLPFLIIGIAYCVINIRKKVFQLLLYWLLLYPIAGAVTLEAPFTSRSIIGAPLTALFIGIGISITILYFKSLLYRRIALSLILTILAINFFLFANFYFNTYQNLSSSFWGWQYGPRDIMSYFLTKKDDYNQLVMMGNFNAPYIFIKFYDPKNMCQNKCIIGDTTLYNPQIKQLFAVGADRMGQLNGLHMRTQKILYYPNNSAAFYIGTLEKQ